MSSIDIEINDARVEVRRVGKMVSVRLLDGTEGLLTPVVDLASALARSVGRDVTAALGDR